MLYKLDLTNQHYSTNIIFAWGKSRIINQNIAQNFFPYRKRYAYFQTIIAAEKPLSPHTNNYLALVSTLSFAVRLRLALFIFFINLHNEYEFCIRARDHRYLAYLFEHLRFQLKPRSKKHCVNFGVQDGSIETDCLPIYQSGSQPFCRIGGSFVKE